MRSKKLKRGGDRQELGSEKKCGVRTNNKEMSHRK